MCARIYVAKREAHSKTMEAPKYSPLNETQLEALQMNLSRAAGWAGVDGVPSAAKVQEIYDAFLEQEIIDDDHLIALGVVFGQLLVDRGGVEWIDIRDEQGSEVGVAVPGKEVFCWPLNMMRKRIERAERLSIDQLCDDTLALLQKRSLEANVGKP